LNEPSDPAQADPSLSDDGARCRRHHHIAFAALLSGASVREAAERAGISKRSLQRCLQRHRGELANAEKLLLDAALQRLRQGLTVAAERLHQIAERGSETNAVAASKALITSYKELSELQLFSERLDQLEQAVCVATKQRTGHVLFPAFKPLVGGRMN
jgi:hypothetical protein